MAVTAIQKSFAPVKRILPSWAANPIRGVATVLFGPIRTAYYSGYIRSSFKRAAVSKDGQPIPWYTYPSIEFLKDRNFEDKIILEFGGGQSTLWWAAKAKHVVTLEGNEEWHDKIKGTMPGNVDLSLVSMESKEANVAEVKNVLNCTQYPKYDVIVIDGLHRREMIDIAIERVSNDGIIICDNSEGYGFHEGFKESGFCRVDFYGNAPGAVLPHATSIQFRPSSSFVFDTKHPIRVIATDP